MFLGGINASGIWGTLYPLLCSFLCCLNFSHWTPIISKKIYFPQRKEKDSYWPTFSTSHFNHPNSASKPPKFSSPTLSHLPFSFSLSLKTAKCKRSNTSSKRNADPRATISVPALQLCRAAAATSEKRSPVRTAGHRPKGPEEPRTKEWEKQAGWGKRGLCWTGGHHPAQRRHHWVWKQFFNMKSPDCLLLANKFWSTYEIPCSQITLT